MRPPALRPSVVSSLGFLLLLMLLLVRHCCCCACVSSVNVSASSVSFRANQRDLLLWRAFACRAAALAASIPGEDLARLLSAFGGQGLRHGALMSAAAAALLPQLQQLSPAAICRVTQAYGQLLCIHPVLQQQLQREIARKALSMTANQVAFTFASLARLGAPPGPLLRVLRKEMIVRHEQLSPGALVVSLHAAAALQLRDSKLLAALAAALCRSVGALDAKGLALAANALTRLKVKNQFLLQLLSAASQRLLQQQQQQQQRMQPRDLAMLLHAAVAGGAASPSFVRDAAAAAGRRMQAYDLQPLCLVAAALTKHYRQQQQQQQQEGGGLTQEDLFNVLEKIGERAGQLATQLTPLAVCCLVDAFASVGYRYGPLLFHVPRHVACFSEAAAAATAAAGTAAKAAAAAEGGTEGYSVCQLAILLRAFGRLGITASAILPHAFKALPPLQQQQQQRQQQQQQHAVGLIASPEEPQDVECLPNEASAAEPAAAAGEGEAAGTESTAAAAAADAANVAAVAAANGGAAASPPLLHSLVWILQSAAADSFLDRQVPLPFIHSAAAAAAVAAAVGMAAAPAAADVAIAGYCCGLLLCRAWLCCMGTSP